MYKMDNLYGQMQRTSTYHPTIVKFICYSTRYALLQIDNGISIKYKEKITDKKYEEIKTSQINLVIMDNIYIKYQIRQ